MGDAARKIFGVWVGICERKKKKIFSAQVEDELASLNPGMNSGKLVYEFYIKKLSFCLSILGIGIGLIFLYVCSSFTDKILEDGKYLERDVPGGKEKTVILDAEIDGIKLQDMTIPVLEKQFTEEELEVFLEEVLQQLPVQILAENESLSYVDKPLNLISSWKNAPGRYFIAC